jgi:hypothetical protein
MVVVDIVLRPKKMSVHNLERYMRCKDGSAVQRYAFERSQLIALRLNKITADSLRSEIWPGDRKLSQHGGRVTSGYLSSWLLAQRRRAICSSVRLPFDPPLRHHVRNESATSGIKLDQREAFGERQFLQNGALVSSRNVRRRSWQKKSSQTDGAKYFVRTPASVLPRLFWWRCWPPEYRDEANLGLVDYWAA